MTVCTLAVHTAAIRLTFAMARDNALPVRRAAREGRSEDPDAGGPAVVIGVLAVLILVVNIGQPQIFTVLTSIAIIMIYLAYLMVTGPMLQKRLQGRVAAEGSEGSGGYFTMGRWGLPVNIVAVVWGVGMAINLAWPREAVYGEPWYNTLGRVRLHRRDPRRRAALVLHQGPPPHRHPPSHMPTRPGQAPSGCAPEPP